MTQSSRPQADNITNYPTGDSGPYSADQWAELFQVLFTGDEEATQGPLIHYLNELAVTTAAGDISVNTGAGFCYGHWLVSNTLITFSPNHANNQDQVVLCNNNTNAPYNTNLQFPTVTGLADYNGTASIEPYSCRLVILTGDGVGGARALVNAGGINMVLLAHYDIDAAGAVTNLIDDRDVCQYSIGIRNRQFLVPALVGWNGGSFTRIAYSGLTLPDNVDAHTYSGFSVPSDFKSTMTVKAVLRAVAGGGGNIYAQSETWYRQCGEADTTHADSTGALAVFAVSASPTVDCIIPVSLIDAAVGDIVDLEFRRAGGNALDTINADVRFKGWLVEYVSFW